MQKSFRSKFFVSQYQKNLLGNTSVYQKISGSEKFYASERRGIKFLLRKLFVTQYWKISLGNTSVFQKIRASQNFMHKKGISLNSVEKSLSHSADKIRTRTLLCFERILVSKSFKQRRGEASRFCRNFLSHRTEKTSPGNHSVFQKIFGREKNLWIRGGGGITIFRRSFLSHCTEIFHWRTLWCFRKILLSKIFLRRRGGGHHRFVEILCLTGPKRKAL